jgi:hypothetical protein
MNNLSLINEIESGPKEILRQYTGCGFIPVFAAHAHANGYYQYDIAYADPRGLLLMAGVRGRLIDTTIYFNFRSKMPNPNIYNQFGYNSRDITAVKHIVL